MRRQRRIPPRGDRAELATAREIETSECANGNNGGIAWAKARNALQDSRLTRSIKNATDRTVSLNRRVFQRYHSISAIRRSSANERPPAPAAAVDRTSALGRKATLDWRLADGTFVPDAVLDRSLAFRL